MNINKHLVIRFAIVIIAVKVVLIFDAIDINTGTLSASHTLGNLFEHKCFAEQ